MATGPASSWKFEVQWDGSSWTDETAYLRGGDGVSVTRGRATEADDIQPGVLSGVLDNLDGRFTPDNPLSALYPNVDDGVRTRFSVTKGATTWYRHQGRLVVGEPTLVDGDTAKAVVPVQAVGLLGTLSNRVLRCDFVERWLDVAQTNDVDIWPMEGTTLANLGGAGGIAKITPEKTGAGSWEVVSGPDGAALDSAVSVTAVGNRGPSIRARVGASITSTNMIVIPFRTGSRTPTTAGSTLAVAQGIDSTGAQVWALRLKDNAGQCDLNLYDASDAFVATLYFGFSASGEDTGDDQWFVFSLEYSGSQSVYLRRSADNTLLAATGVGAIDARNTRVIILGSQVTATYGPLVASEYNSSSHATFVSATSTTTSQARIADMNLYADFPSSSVGTRNAQIALKAISGRTAFDVLAEVCRTTGGLVVEDRSSYVLTHYDADAQRSSTVALSVVVDDDVASEFPWRKGDVPSNVTATYPGGQVTVTDSTRVRVDESVETCAADAISARYVANARVKSSRRLRLTKLVIELSTAANDLWSSLMALEVGDRIRVTLGSSSSLLVTQYGYTYVDVYAMGWTETYGQDVALFEIDTIPADDPAGGVFGTGLRSKFSAGGTMTVTGGTAYNTTANGTLIITTSTGPALTQTASVYPMWLNYNGEDVQITTPPASATSPQTVTTTTRGGNNTVARAHALNEPIDVSLKPTFTF